MDADQPNGRCTATNRNGFRCSGKACNGREVCAFHDPEQTERLKASRAAGGHARSNPPAVVPSAEADVPVSAAGDIVALIADTINRIRKGTMDPRVGNAVGYLASVALRAFEVGELEARLAQLECVVKSDTPRQASDPFERRIRTQCTSGENEL